MSSLESALLAVVLIYSLWFLVSPHPALHGERVPEPVAPPQPREDKALGPAPEVALPEPVAVAVVEVAAPGLAQRLRLGLSRTRTQLVGSLEGLFAGTEVRERREQVLESLFETLVRCDVGVAATDRLIKAIKEQVPAQQLSELAPMRDALSRNMRELLHTPDEAYTQNVDHRPAGARKLRDCLAAVFSDGEALRFAAPVHVVMIVGVNGVGKTTTTGKLAHKLRRAGFHVVVGAADTFRAAAVDQLRVWAERAEAEFVTMPAGGDPAAVAFEAVKRATGAAPSAAVRGTVCLVDTAGRLHNRKDLMEELGKVGRVMGKQCDGAPHEVLLVVDATTGQNALQQARLFAEAVPLSGVILTKLDGTAKGGVAMALASEQKLAIDFVGVGEDIDDLQAFNPDDYVEALFGVASSAN